MKVQFCGAAQEVTGSAHLITLDNGYKILLDCGLYQGRSESWKNFNENWLFKPSEIDCLILSHAHIDHTGRVPKLVKDGFKGQIHCTHATRSLCAIMLLDSAHIQEKDTEYYNKRVLQRNPRGARRIPLYTKKDAIACMENFVGHPYNQWLTIAPGVRVKFNDAGHILGSASVNFRIEEGGETKTIAFTGDVGRPNRPILRDPQPMPQADFIICESTYGNKDHIGQPDEMDKFLAVIKKACVEKKGKLLIPAFSIGRTQELVYMLDRMETQGLLPEIPVYVDSPLAVNATTIFGAHPECYDRDISDYLLIDDNPFGFNRLKYVKELDMSKRLNAMQGPCIIISAAGMMNAGRSKHHLFNSIDNEKNTVFIVGYCSPETPGGKLRMGKEEIRLFGETKPVKAEIVIMDSFSAHADRGELLDFLHNQKENAKKIFLVHGTLERQEAFKALLLENEFASVEIPALGDEFVLK